MKQPQIPVKMLTTLTILMVFLCVGSYLLSPKWQAVRTEYQRQRDPLHQFASQQTPEAQLQALQDKIRANPQNSEQWALRTVRRCNYVVRTLNCMRRWRRCCITRPANI
ncbi:Formate-dependent nitrite reductase complex subunit nrfG [Klebsiella pneumoniae]|nr:Formate-dependent nitrite reductase complex subunit nrfG [Klebsiella pneumoniae]